MVSHALPRRVRGFTLTELLAVVAIVAILSAVAAPAFSAMVASARSRSVSSELYATLARTRSEALKRNAEVTLAPVTSGQWQSGWSIGAPGDPSRKLDDHPPVRGATVSGPANVVYLPNGRIKGASLPSFDIAVSGASQHRCVRVDLSGRPNQSTATTTC
jgi:type IV fimbrial biogenesis protein FimT